MSQSLIELFGFMTCTFILGLLLGWTAWRYGGISRKKMESLKSEVEFWRGRLDNNRNELWTAEEELTALRKEAAILKKRLSAQKA